MHSRFVLAFVIAAVVCPAAANAADRSAPGTRKTDTTDVLHGVTVADPYRWLEDGENPEVAAWIEAQTRRTRAYLDALPNRSALRARLESLITAASPRYSGLQTAGGRLFAAYYDPKVQQVMLAVMGEDADPAKARVVVNPNQLDPTGDTAFDWYVPSPDGRLVAISLSKGGSEDGSLHLFDVDTAKQVGEVIPNVQYPTAGGDVAWTPDGKAFWYTRYPGPDRPEEEQHFYQQVWFHRLGDDPKNDQHVFGKDLPKVAEIALDYSNAAGALLVTVQDGDGGEFAHFVRGDDGRFVQVTRFKDGVNFAAFGPDRALYLVSQRGKPRREILKLSPGVLELAQAKPIVPASDDVIDVAFWGEDAIVFAERPHDRALPRGRALPSPHLRPRWRAAGRCAASGGRRRRRGGARRRRPAVQRRDLPGADAVLSAGRWPQHADGAEEHECQPSSTTWRSSVSSRRRRTARACRSTSSGARERSSTATTRYF